MAVMLVVPPRRFPEDTCRHLPAALAACYGCACGGTLCSFMLLGTHTHLRFESTITLQHAAHVHMVFGDRQ